MIYKERLQQEISNLIEKIRLDWSRIKTHSPGIHKIDKDIITSDIRRLYDLIYEVDFENPGRRIQEPNVSEPLQKTIENIENSLVFDQDPQQAEPEAIPEISQKTDDDLIPDEALTKIVETDFLQSANDNPFEGFPTIETQTVYEKDHQQKPAETTQKPQPVITKTPVKTTLDLFTAPKTIADTFQNDTDNSFATRMQHNPIQDIKSAIGINEKFLFINSIFHGEISAYNKAIGRLNEFSEFYQALHFIDELKASFEKENNKDAFASLLDIVKRKFQQS